MSERQPTSTFRALFQFRCVLDLEMFADTVRAEMANSPQKVLPTMIYVSDPPGDDRLQPSYEAADGTAFDLERYQLMLSSWIPRALHR